MMDFIRMLSLATAAEESSTMTIAECIVYAVQHPLVLTIAVLAVFSLVMTVLYLSRVRRDQAVNTSEIQEAPSSTLASSPVCEPPKDDAALIAAITAAVAEYLDLEAAEKGVAPPASFHIVSYKRKR